ncbi:MAG: glutamine--fructose-6-phosphate transaminase (isomerizing) [Campylobacterales bacterium]
MCGIVGGKRVPNLVDFLIEGLRELEYRGYDSAGIGVIDNGELRVVKAVGKLFNLVQKVEQLQWGEVEVGIGHTRWATHGKPTEINAHPHTGEFAAVVHNGIIENYRELRRELERENIQFLSETDTEVIVRLFEHYWEEGRGGEAFRQTIDRLEGAYAILLISEKEPDKIYFAKKGSPLILVQNQEQFLFASSDTPLIGRGEKGVYLEDQEWGWVDTQIHLFREGIPIEPHFKPLPTNKSSAQKEGFRFFMEKEIYEQPRVMEEFLLGRVDRERIQFPEIEPQFWEEIDSITISACGTSYHAGLVGKYLLERYAQIPVNVEVASELRYRNPVLSKKGLFLVISQSGETADTLETLKMANRQGLKTLALCNVDNSSIVREADRTILLRAGIEKGVASTKAFANQVLALWALATFLGGKEGEVPFFYKAIQKTRLALHLHDRIKRLSKRYLHGHGFFFIGRDIFYPLALEGALKLKEISYLHAEGYPAGEMKHGPIALADPELFTIALLSRLLLFEKTKSNIEELSARDATILTICSEPIEFTDDYLPIFSGEHPMEEFFQMMVVVQLLAMEVAIRLGNDVDMPRNLAKSVTVE